MQFILFTWLFVVVTPALLWVAYALLEFWTRTPQSYSLLFKLQNFKYRWAAEDKSDGLQLEGSFFSWLCFDVACLGIVTMFMCVIVEHHGFQPILWMLLTALLLAAPRYILDITKSIKYNFKTRDSDRLKELESEVERLKTKVK